MSNPIVVDIPHKLGAAEAKRRIQEGIGGLKDHIPGGAQVHHDWAGDRLQLGVTALNQEVNASIDVKETLVRVEVTLPPALSFFRKPVEALLRRKGGQLLEDRSRS